MRVSSRRNILKTERSLSCRVCDSIKLEEYLNFGLQSLGTLPCLGLNESEELFEKVLDYCPSCGHLQLRYTVDPLILYGDYPRLSSTNFARYEENMAVSAARFAVEGGAYVLEIGCNDGRFLKRAQLEGAYVLGVDAAKNCVAATRDLGLECIEGFFNDEVCDEILRRYGPPSVVICRHVLEHVERPVDFLNKLSRLLRRKSELWIETPDFVHAVELGDDTCFTEQHVSYFSDYSFDYALWKSGLVTVANEYLPNNWSRALFRRVKLSESSGNFASECSTLKYGSKDRFRLGRELLESRILELAEKSSLFLGGAFCRSVNLLGHGIHVSETLFRGVCDDNPALEGKLLRGSNLKVSRFDDLAGYGNCINVLGTVGIEERVVQNKRSLVDAGVRFFGLYPPRFVELGTEEGESQ